MFSRVSRASTAALRTIRRAANRTSDSLAERRWERRQLSAYAPVDEGEVTALLRRMGAPASTNTRRSNARRAAGVHSFRPTATR
jgi:hypothetical protein